MDKKLGVVFNNLDDHEAVMKTFFMLCKELTLHYTTKDAKLDQLADFILKGCVWFGQLAQIAGLDKDDFDGYDDIGKL